MTLRRRLGAILIVIGVGIAILPLLEQAFGAYSQWQLERQWDEAVRHAQNRLPEPTPAAALVQPIVRFFSLRTALAAPAHRGIASPKPALRRGDNRALRSRASTHKSTTSRARLPRQSRHIYAPMGLVRLEIPRLDLHAFVVDGTSGFQLARGPAHFPGTALPGQPGNCAIAGHRNVYGSWFRDLNRLRPGDLIILRTPRQAFTYRVTRSRIVLSNDMSILRPTAAPTVTLVTCMIPHARNRLVVFGQEVS